MLVAWLTGGKKVEATLENDEATSNVGNLMNSPHNNQQLLWLQYNVNRDQTLLQWNLSIAVTLQDSHFITKANQD